MIKPDKYLSPAKQQQIIKRLLNGDTSHHLATVYQVPIAVIQRLRLDALLVRQQRSA